VGEDSVFLFECDANGLVLTKEIGTVRRRKILRRSAAMEALMRQEAEKVVSDHKGATGIYDGIVYLMHTRDTDGGVVATSESLRPLEGLQEYCRLISSG
jgi:hypothetical protein